MSVTVTVSDPTDTAPFFSIFPSLGDPPLLRRGVLYAFVAGEDLGLHGFSVNDGTAHGLPSTPDFEDAFEALHAEGSRITLTIPNEYAGDRSTGARTPRESCSSKSPTTRRLRRHPRRRRLPRRASLPTTSALDATSTHAAARPPPPGPPQPPQSPAPAPPTAPPPSTPRPPPPRSPTPPDLSPPSPPPPRDAATAPSAPTAPPPRSSRSPRSIAAPPLATLSWW